VFIIVAIFPPVAWVLTGSLPLTLGYLGLFIVFAIRRLTARQPVSITSISKRQVLINRLLFDRDMRDKEAWMSLVEQQEKRRKLASSNK